MKWEAQLDSPDFMVPPQKIEFAWGKQLLCEQVGDNFKAESASVHVVAEEKECCRRQVNAHAPEDFLKTAQIPVVAVQIA